MPLSKSFCFVLVSPDQGSVDMLTDLSVFDGMVEYLIYNSKSFSSSLNDVPRVIVRGVACFRRRCSISDVSGLPFFSRCTIGTYYSSMDHVERMLNSGDGCSAPVEFGIRPTRPGRKLPKTKSTFTLDQAFEAAKQGRLFDIPASVLVPNYVPLTRIARDFARLCPDDVTDFKSYRTWVSSLSSLGDLFDLDVPHPTSSTNCLSGGKGGFIPVSSVASSVPSTPTRLVRTKRVRPSSPVPGGSKKKLKIDDCYVSVDGEYRSHE